MALLLVKLEIIKLNNKYMTNEYLTSEEAQKLIAELSVKMDELIVEGRTYHSEVNRSEYGTSSSGVYFYENETLHDFNNFGKYTSEEIIDHLKVLRKTSFSDLVTFFPAYSKIKFTFKKGEKIKAERYTVLMLLESISKKIEEDVKLHSEEDGVLLKAESLIHFKKEADEIGMFVDSTFHYTSKTRSFEHVTKSDDVIAIFHQLDGKLETLYFRYENGIINAQSQPAFEAHGLQPLTVSQIELAPDYKLRKDAAEQCKILRHDFFNSLGNLDERIIYLRVGGFRDHSWPENSTSHNSCKMRVIHTQESAILITDGLSDVYGNSNQDQNLEYNGIGAEFYMEFYGNIPFENIHEHFAVALINSTSQIAIGHGDFKKLLENHGETSVEFTEENIEIWVNRENHANQDLSTFLPEADFIKNDSFAVLLGLESKTVPKRLPLNLEEILLVNIKPVRKKWLSKTKLRSDSNDVAKEARQSIREEFKESGEWNLVPLTYQNEYIKSDSGNKIVHVPIFPF